MMTQIETGVLEDRVVDFLLARANRRSALTFKQLWALRGRGSRRAVDERALNLVPMVASNRRAANGLMTSTHDC
jgi:hypothetical protein